MSTTAQHAIFGPFFHEGELVTEPKLYHYLPGTTQEKPVWSDYHKTITALNPIRGDANGLVTGYFDGLYKIEIRTSDGSVVLGQWDGVQIITTLAMGSEGEVLRAGPIGTGQDAEDVVARWMRLIGHWDDPSAPGASSQGDRIVIYDSGRDKTAIGMHQQNGLWIQSHGANGQPAFAVWSAASFTSPSKRFEVTFDGRVKVAAGGKLHTPVVATVSLPAADAAEDGSILIEDAGAGDRNLIIYAGGQRFRIDGGTAF